MKVLHVTLASTYRIGQSYQENLLTKFHKLMGHEVFVITKDDKIHYQYEIIDNGNKIFYLKHKRNNFIERIISEFFTYERVEGLKYLIEKISPDIIFVHNGFFLDAPVVIKYCKSNPKVKLFVDNHADYYNSPIKNPIKKILIGYYPRMFSKHAIKYWGTTPWRVKYLQDVYKIPSLKTDLLLMGGDDTLIDFKNKQNIRDSIRQNIGLDGDDFVILTGGKIDLTKNIHLLIEAVYRINNNRIKLVVFGVPDYTVKSIIEPFIKSNNIIYIGYIKSEKIYNWFLSCDLVCFPGTHSVLWEQALACGIPAIFKYWEGMTHVDVGGNCCFLYKNSLNEIKDTILKIFEDKDLYKKMQKESKKAISKFSYKAIAQKSIEI